MSYIPELENSITIEDIEYEEDFFIVYEKQSKNRVKINRITKDLLNAIDNKRNIDGITSCLKRKYSENSNLNTQTVESLICQLQSVGIVKSDQKVKKKKKSYIWLKFTIIPKKIINAISKLFTIFFIKQIYYLLFFSTLFLLFTYIFFLTKSDFHNFISTQNILLYIPIGYFSKFLHEIGHASALKKSNIEPGPIGFGFYLFNPVFYADVSAAWKLAPEKRVIINIAGMYFQLLYSLLFGLIFIVTMQKWFLVVSFLNFLTILPNLNPFIRYDGYWILTDLTRINNLIDTAKNKFMTLFKWMKKRDEIAFPLKSKKDYFLLFYFLFNKIMVVIFVIFILFYSENNRILELPNDILIFCTELVSCKDCSILNAIKNFVFDNFFPFIFYLLLTVFFIKILLKSFVNVLVRKK